MDHRMRCDDWRVLIDAYIDNSLDESLNERMEKHLLSCSLCTYEVHSIRQSLQLLKSNVDYFETSPQYRERTLATLLSDHSQGISVVSHDITTQWTLPFILDKEN